MQIRAVPGAERPLVQWLLLFLCVVIVAFALALVRRERGTDATVRQLKSELEEAAKRQFQLEAQVARERSARESFEIGLGTARAANSPAAIPLQPGLSRAGRPAQELRIPPDASRVILVLPVGGRPYARYRTGIRPWSGGDEIWANAMLRSSRDDPRRLFVAVPAEVLTRGAYELSLKGISADGRSEDLSVFTFEVDSHGSSR